MRRRVVMRGLVALAGGGILLLLLVGCERTPQVGASAQAESAEPGLPLLVVEKIEPKKALPEQPFPVEIRVKNPREEPLLNVEVVLELPEGLRLVSADPPPQGGLVWSFPNLPGGAEVRIRLQLEGEVGEFPNTVKVKAARLVTAEASGVVALSPIPGLTAHLEDSPGVVPVGGRVTYTLGIRGQGYGKAEEVSVRIELPEGLTVDSVEAPTSHTVEGREIDFEPFELGAGEEVLIKIVLVAEKPGDMVVRALIAYQGFAHRLVLEEGTVAYGG